MVKNQLIVLCVWMSAVKNCENAPLQTDSIHNSEGSMIELNILLLVAFQ